MPTISTETVHLDRADGTKTFQKKTCVDAAGVFSVKLPPEFAPVLGKDVIKAVTRAGIDQEWRVALAQFRERSTTTSRVILYSVALRAYIFHDRVELQTGLDGLSHREPGVSAELWAGVFDESVTTTPGGKKLYSYRPVADTLIPASLRRALPDSFNWNSGQWGKQMPWTKEREQFFCRLGLGFESLIKQLHALTHDASALIAVADGGDPKLLLS